MLKFTLSHPIGTRTSHEKDTNYDNVILHVVWQDDASVFRSDNSEIATLELKEVISRDLLLAYRNLLDRGRRLLSIVKDK